MSRTLVLIRSVTGEDIKDPQNQKELLDEAKPALITVITIVSFIIGFNIIF